jgi:acetyl-CoA C-acetyltransferase
VTEVLFGNCLMAGQGQAPARQAAFKGGLPKSAGAVTLSKMCGSGMKAAMFAHDMLLAGSHDVMVAGGMESMTNAPYLLLKGRGGYRMGHDRIFDHMMLDGLEDAYEPGRSMGTFGEDCAAKYSFTREHRTPSPPPASARQGRHRIRRVQGRDHPRHRSRPARARSR